MAARQRQAKAPKTPKQMVMARTLPDADDPRNGLEQQFDHADEAFEDGRPIRFYATVLFEVTEKNLSAKGKPPTITVVADVVEAPLDDAEQKEIQEIQEKHRLARARRDGAQDTLPERPEPSVLRSLPSGAEPAEVLAEPANLRQDG